MIPSTDDLIEELKKEIAALRKQRSIPSYSRENKRIDEVMDLCLPALDRAKTLLDQLKQERDAYFDQVEKLTDTGLKFCDKIDALQSDLSTTRADLQRAREATKDAVREGYLEALSQKHPHRTFDEIVAALLDTPGTEEKK